MENELVPLKIESRITVIRELQVMLDSDLAELYGVKTRILNQAVKRNHERFPERFMFQLSEEEFSVLRSQSVTSKTDNRGGRKYLHSSLTLRHTTKIHDRFMIIDNEVLYHIGASLKDLGKKCFAFQVLDPSIIPAILQNI